MASVLLVCTGNICRSPMAEGLLRDRFERLGIDRIRVVSSGVAGLERSPAVSEAVRAMAELGIDIAGQQPETLGRYLGRSFDHIVTVCDGTTDT